MATGTQTQQNTYAVIGADGVYLSNGGRMRLPEFQQLEYWLDAAQRRGIDDLWLHPSAPWTWLDADIDACADWVIQGGGGDDLGEPWWTATHMPGVYGRHAIVQPRYDDRAPWADTPDAETLRAALRAFREHVGLDWRRSPGATGTRLLRTLHSGQHATRLDLDGDPPPPALGAMRDGAPLSFTRPLHDSERGWYLHSFDVNGQFLAACSSLALGVGAWQHIKRPQLPAAGDKAPLRPGYYFVRAAEKAKEGPCPTILTNHTGEWVTAPTVTLLREQGATLTVSECYVWQQSKRYLEPWYKTLRVAREHLLVERGDGAPYALDAVKGLYRHSVAWLESRKWDRSEDTLYRPDWAQAIRALARANLLRTIYRVARTYHAYPLAVGSDCVYYLSPNPDPLASAYVSPLAKDCLGDGLRLSNHLGHFKVKDSGVPVSEVEAYIKGRQWNLVALQHYLNVRSGRRAA